MDQEDPNQEVDYVASVKLYMDLVLFVEIHQWQWCSGSSMSAHPNWTYDRLLLCQTKHFPCCPAFY